MLALRRVRLVMAGGCEGGGEGGGGEGGGEGEGSDEGICAAKASVLPELVSEVEPIVAVPSKEPASSAPPEPSEAIPNPRSAPLPPFCTTHVSAPLLSILMTTTSLCRAAAMPPKGASEVGPGEGGGGVGAGQAEIEKEAHLPPETDGSHCVCICICICVCICRGTSTAGDR